MATLTVDSSLSTGIDPAFAAVTSIELEDVPIGEGGFGVAFRARLVNGVPPRVPQVVKVLKDVRAGMARRGFETIQELQRRMEKKNRELAAGTGRGLLETYPVLLGAPQFSFSGTLNGRPVLGFSSNNLVSLGFEELGGILEDDARFRRFISAPLHARLEIARALAEGFDLLNKQFMFLHADFKAEAIFVDAAKARCAIIDFDSGAVARDANDKPSTFGTLQDWLAPEIFAQLAQNNPCRVVKVDALSDAWSVSVAIHYLLLGCHPLFFLTEVSRRSVTAYLAACRWPDGGPGVPFFDGASEAPFRGFQSYLRGRVPPPVVDRLVSTINGGYFSPGARTTPGQWSAVLGGVLQPRLASFKADRSLVDDDAPVTLRWEAPPSGTLTLDPSGLDVTGRSSVVVPISGDTTFTLTLTSPSGKKASRSLRVGIAKTPPRILSFACDTAVVSSPLRPARLSWAVAGRIGRLSIDSGVGDVTGRSSLAVLPRKDTTFRLRAENQFGVVESTVTVRVSRTPAQVELTADRTLLSTPTAVTLTWNAGPDAHEVWFDGHGRVAPRGSCHVFPRQDTTYRLRATTFFGVTSEKSVDIRVSKDPPKIELFVTNATTLPAGGRARVAWKTTGAEQVTIEPAVGAVPLSGSLDLHPTATTDLTLTAFSAFGVEARRTITLKVWKPAELELVPQRLRASKTALAIVPARLAARPLRPVRKISGALRAVTRPE